MLTSAYKHSSSTTTRRLPPLFAYNNQKHHQSRIIHAHTNRRFYAPFAPFAPFATSTQIADKRTTVINNTFHKNELFGHSGYFRNIGGSRLFSVVPDQMVYDENDQSNIENKQKDHLDSPLQHQDLTQPPQPTSLSDVEIKSKPVPNGNWNPSNPLSWTKNFGRRNPETEQELFRKAQLKPGDEGYFDVSKITVPGVTIVRTKEEAKIVMERLMSKESEGVIHACDTEVMEIDLKEVGPVGNGYVTCVSIYSGDDFDYGLGDGPGTALWIDNIDDSFGVLQCFKEFFEDERFLTVWHNYGFDRHVMWNEGIDVRGFKGDTMHMARLEDTSRAKYGAGTGYSLEALTADILGRRKKPMKEIFGVARLRKDGSEGSLIDVPPVEVLQRDPRFRIKWIIYSAYDAESTWRLRNELQKKLETLEWVSN